MSFQGDVGGIGLADLLQSLARGRPGVLTLHTRGGLKASIGIKDGRLHLLPEPDEDPEIWRRIARNAWSGRGDDLVDALHMEEIARARRTETLYRLLDSEGVHFRFAPGSVPTRPEGSGLRADEPGLEQSGPSRSSVWTEPMSIEATLLEFARLQDEGGDGTVHWPECEHAVLQRLDAAPGKGDIERLHQECDGTSTLQEIADRLGWTLRQTRNNALGELRRGALRFSTPEELLYLVQQELLSGNRDRAVSRLRSWLAVAPGGPMADVDAQLFEHEWVEGRLQPVLLELPARQARSFLRRLDYSRRAPQESLQRWRQYATARPGDPITQLRHTNWLLRASGDPAVPSVRDLLVQCRTLLKDGRRSGAASYARIAMQRAPDGATVRIEIGQCMLQAGIVAEADEFLLDALRTMIDAKRADLALPVLRQFVQVLPEHREGRRLFMRARAQTVRRSLLHKHSLVGFAVIAALATGALVQYRSGAAQRERIQEINALSPDPRAALALLRESFPDDNSGTIQALRSELESRLRLQELAIRTAWTDRYNAAAVECTVGDPLLGLRRLIDLPPPPSREAGEQALPLVSDLYNGLAARLETQVEALGREVLDSQDQLRAEQRLTASLQALAEMTAGTEDEQPRRFAERLARLIAQVAARDEQRGQDRARRAERENLARQDVLVNTARAHTKAGDFVRAREAYQRLVETDPSGRLAGLFAREIRVVEESCAALSEAADLARAGQHKQAHARLKGTLQNAEAWLLPWRVTSIPPGARARFPDGTERVTPFTVESEWKEVVTFTLELKGHEPVDVRVAEPADQVLTLSRIPERAWLTQGRVEAPPVAAGEDHIVCDRAGKIARVGRAHQVVWQRSTGSLAGIGRAPVFLPRRPGHLLVVSEDGEVWIVDASSGAMEGPWSAGAPPVAGPEVTTDGVTVRFRNGQRYEWSTRLLPELVVEDAADAVVQAEPVQNAPAPAAESGLSILRRRSTAASRFDSPWGPYTVRVEAEAYVLDATVKDEKDAAGARTQMRATVRREGDWNYMAWEAPNVTIPHGRLWISDARGLRSYTP